MKTISTAIAVTLLCVMQMACSKSAPADLSEARPVMDKLIEAERERKGSHGTFWRDGQAVLDRNNVFKSLGVDLDAAPNFEFSFAPSEGGMDPKLTIIAKGKGAASKLMLTCVQDGTAEKAECTESGV